MNELFTLAEKSKEILQYNIEDKIADIVSKNPLSNNNKNLGFWIIIYTLVKQSANTYIRSLDSKLNELKQEKNNYQNTLSTLKTPSFLNKANDFIGNSKIAFVITSVSLINILPAMLTIWYLIVNFISGIYELPYQLIIYLLISSLLIAYLVFVFNLKKIIPPQIQEELFSYHPLVNKYKNNIKVDKNNVKTYLSEIDKTLNNLKNEEQKLKTLIS